MEGIEDPVEAYLAEVRPQGQKNSRRWFMEHPQAVTDATKLRAAGLSKAQIRAYLVRQYGFPFADDKAVNRAWQ